MFVAARRIAESEVAGKRLGCHVKHDERSKRMVAPQADGVVSVRHKVGGAGWLPLDQGPLDSCTANALVGSRMLDPNVGGRGRFLEKDAVWLY